MSASSDRANTWAVILAAGASRRMGSPKQLLSWQGTPLVCRAVQAARSVVGERVLVVTGCCAGEVDHALASTGVRSVHNAQWNEGVASSLRVAVGALPDECDAVLFCSCDPPGVGAPQLQALLDARHGDQVVAARYADTVGIPACFPRSRFAALSSLHGERGAKALLKAENDLLEVAIDQAKWDLDAPADIPLVAAAIGQDMNNEE